MALKIILASLIVENVGKYHDKRSRKDLNNLHYEDQCWQYVIFVDMTFRYSYFSTCRKSWIYQARHHIRRCETDVLHISTSLNMINIFKYRIRISVLDAMLSFRQKRQKYLRTPESIIQMLLGGNNEI